MKEVTAYVNIHLKGMEKNQRMQVGKMIWESRNISIYSLEEVTSMCKSMIIRRGSMHEKLTSQRLPLKEPECTLNPDMSKLFKVFHL